MTFNEYTIKKKKGAKDILISISLYLLATLLSIVLLILFMQFAQITLLVCFGIFYMAHWFSAKLNKEYEYIFTQDNICIDVILNKSRRKRIISFDLDEVEIIAATDNQTYKHELSKQYDKTVDATSGSKLAIVYFAVVNRERRVLIKFEPPYTALKEIYKYAPSKIKIEG